MALLLAASMVAGCAGPVREPPPLDAKAELSRPGAILATDQVRDATTAIHLGVARCFPRQSEASFQAELQDDHWFVWADTKPASFSAEVAKRDGAVTECTNLQL
ncbi:MAG TPA: hypothetical protein VN723_02090 [Rhizomicrobium sp.]|nr:hypothetical protein [Rhizomicrobium sp.]